MITDASFLTNALKSAGFNSTDPTAFEGKSFKLGTLDVKVVEVHVECGRVRLVLDHPQIRNFTYPEGLEF